MSNDLNALMNKSIKKQRCQIGQKTKYVDKPVPKNGINRKLVSFIYFYDLYGNIAKYFQLYFNKV